MRPPDGGHSRCRRAPEKESRLFLLSGRRRSGIHSAYGIGLLHRSGGTRHEARAITYGTSGKTEAAATLVVAAEGAKRLRDAMRNPDSFRPAQALIMNDQAVCYEFRSQNGFGGFNVGHAVLSPSGELKTNETSGFYALWDRECADKKGADKTWEVGYAAGFHGVFSDK